MAIRRRSRKACWASPNAGSNPAPSATLRQAQGKRKRRHERRSKECPEPAEGHSAWLIPTLSRPIPIPSQLPASRRQGRAVALADGKGYLVLLQGFHKSCKPLFGRGFQLAAGFVKVYQI